VPEPDEDLGLHLTSFHLRQKVRASSDEHRLLAVLGHEIGRLGD
jgi:hypothetical protein